MTNKELQTWFEELRQTKDNVFDILMELDSKADEYEEMELSNYLPSVREAYDYYWSHRNMTEEVIQGVALGDYSKLIENLDIDKLFEQIPEEYRESIAELINEASNK